MTISKSSNSTESDRIETLHQNLDRLRARILTSDNTTCFIERESYLKHLKPEARKQPGDMQYSFVLKNLLENVSTPVEQDDVFLGRFVEGKLPGPVEVSPHSHPIQPMYVDIEFLVSPGHFAPNWETLINKGLDALVKESWDSAKRLGTEDASWFAENAEICCNAIIDLAKRYAKYAKKVALISIPEVRENLLRAAEALEIVPAKPAPDFFSALQSIWIIWMISSGYIGQRDLTYERIDQYLNPLYKKGIEDGTLTPELATAYIAHLFIKNKEIIGISTDSYEFRPIPCFGSNQYATIGGRDVNNKIAVNDLTYRILEGKTLSDVPQPTLNIRMDSENSREFKEAVAQAVKAHPDQIHVWNDKEIIKTLKTYMPHLEWEDLVNYGFWACMHINFMGKHYITDFDYFIHLPELLMNVLGKPGEISSFNDLKDRFKTELRNHIRGITNWKYSLTESYNKRRFHYESVLMDGCIEKCKDVQTGGVKYLTHYHQLASIATAADSLMAIKKLVYEDKRYSLPEFMKIVNNNFKDHEPLRQEIIYRIPKYGNDIDEVDDIAVEITKWAYDLMDEMQFEEGRLFFFSIYSLTFNIWKGTMMGATPDGRLAGYANSKDQNPTQGMDRNGITSRLKSASKLLQSRSVTGGLDIKFSKMPSIDIFISMVETYFELGGKVLAFNMVSKETLLAAQKNPEQFQSLTVRIAGYSDYFVNINPGIQWDIIRKTKY